MTLMDNKSFALVVKRYLEQKLERVVTPKQMEFIWNEINIQFINDEVHYNDQGFKDYVSKDLQGSHTIAHRLIPVYNWYDLLAGSPEPIKLPVTVDLNKMMC